MDARALERDSSAFTLSDMEVFLFPELLHALVLANVASPRLWRWRDDPWFAGVRRQPFARQLQRLKQYVMDQYSFNLDLETWGLTTKPRELARFRDFVDLDILSRSNALFGYEGDKYYFDLDIRRHFGLDSYEGDVIPYWKTETLEAMDAFRFKPGYERGAGECVSLSTLYAAALFVVLGVPLEEVFVLATPLHSQAFITRGEGALTNNRRLVTKKMWFNGTVLSEKARRALQKERVTVLSHISGWTHIEYEEATIAPEAYHRLASVLGDFLTTRIDFELFTSFLRANPDLQHWFEFQCERDGHPRFIAAEKLYRYEQASRCRIGDPSMRSLLDEVDSEDFEPAADPVRHRLDDLRHALDGRALESGAEETCRELHRLLAGVPEVDAICQRLHEWATTRPRLPAADKRFVDPGRLKLDAGWSREQTVEYLTQQAPGHPIARLSALAGHHVNGGAWPGFLKACLERQPVSLQWLGPAEAAEAHARLTTLPDDSIYEDTDALATPDEVANFGRGDGLEKALVLANLLASRGERGLRLRAGGGTAELQAGPRSFAFPSAKRVEIELEVDPERVAAAAAAA